MNDGVPVGGSLQRYHELTKHSPASIMSSRHRLDWSNKPVPFKLYHGLDGRSAPADVARLCRLSNGVLRWRRDATGERHGFRAAPCTGALYHVELYLAVVGRDDLPAGLYHYGAHDDGLRRLREGDVRGHLVEATAGSATIRTAPLVFVLTSTFWRNAWKYQARAYRHSFWDSGAVVANLLALAAADGISASVVMGFADREVNELLGVDGVTEAAVAVVAVGDGAVPPGPAGPLPTLDVATEPASPRPIRYPEIESAHRASSLPAERVARWRAAAGGESRAVPPRVTDASIDEVIERRRSTRRFGPRPIGRAELETIVAIAMSPVPGVAFVPDAVAPFLIVNAVEGMASGAYGPGLEPIRLADSRRVAGALALWQGLGAEAAVDLYFLSDLHAGSQRLGERGYRVAQMAGGIAGGRAELAATGLGLGATGLTFFDDEVTRFFEPAARGRQVMYLAAVGERG